MDQIIHALDALAFARAVPEVLTVAAAVVTNMRWRANLTSPTAAELLALPLIIKIGELRPSKGFEFKEAADAFLGAAMRTLGPEVLFKSLPLNLEPEKR